MHVTYFQFESRSRTTRCRVLHLFASPEHTVQLKTHDTTTHTDAHTHNTTQHSTAQNRTRHTEAKREREKSEIGGETGGEREERVLTRNRSQDHGNFLCPYIYVLLTNIHVLAHIFMCVP